MRSGGRIARREGAALLDGPVPSYAPMPTQLTTRRLTLEPWRDEDLDDYQALVHERDPRTAAAPRNGRPTREDLRASISRHRATLDEVGIGLLTVRRGGEFLGYCGLIVGRASLEEPEVAYELLRRTHGRGYATEAAQAVVAAAADTGRRRLWASVRSWNAPSLRVLEKLGFLATTRVDDDGFGDLVWWTRRLPVGPGRHRAA
jgi:RimJ/RimL family protein N-acetyltransferase